MKAASLIKPAHVEIRDVACPAVEECEVLIAPIRVGICGSDVSLYQGHRPAPYPHTLGHELVGRVVAVGARVASLAPGMRVIVEPNYPCGTCKFCRTGRGSICPNKKSMGVNVPGCFAECVTAPAEFVWAVPDSMSDMDAATIEPFTVALHALFQTGVRMGDTVAVVGCGVIGLLLIHAAVRQGVRVLAHDKFEEKLERARQLGAMTPGGEPEGIWESENVTTVFECAGASSTVELSIGAAPRGSRVVLLGLSTSTASFTPLHLVRKGIRIEPSLIYDHPSDFARALELVAAGVLKPSSVVSDTFEFDSIGRALELASTGQSAKIHVIVSQGDWDGVRL